MYSYYVARWSAARVLAIADLNHMANSSENVLFPFFSQLFLVYVAFQLSWPLSAFPLLHEAM